MNSNSFEQYRIAVINILAKVLDGHGDQEILDRSNPSWDSLKQLQISLEIEDRFQVELSDEQAIQFFDVDSILQLLVELNVDKS